MSAKGGGNDNVDGRVDIAARRWIDFPRAGQRCDGCGSMPSVMRNRAGAARGAAIVVRR